MLCNIKTGDDIMNIEKKIRNPKQKRSILMKEKILDAAMVLICEKGYFDTTTNEIAKTANISIGSLYSYFADKDTILMELLERYNKHFMIVFEDIKTEANAQLYKTDKRKWLECLVDKIIQLHLSTKAFAKELNVLYYAKPEVATIMDTQSKKVQASILHILMQNKEDIKISDLEAVSIVILDFISALVDRIVFKENSIDTERTIDTGIDMLYACIMQ